MDNRPHVVIVGAGFGGLAAAKALAGAPVRITVVDRNNYHLFQPLLYQVAGAALSPGDIAEPIRSILARQANASVRLGEVRRVDLDRRLVLMDDGEMAYDHLILAAGARNQWFGHDEQWAPHAPGLKTLDDALEIRQRILRAFEQAEWSTDEAARQRLLTFVAIGGGPTGVEQAGSLVEIARQTLRRDFRNIDPAAARVVLIEAGDAVLPPFPETLRLSAARQLAEIGVELRLGVPVTAIDERGVLLGDELIPAATVLWSAGVRAEEVGASLRVPTDRTGRVIVEPDLSVPGHDNVRVIGDLACFTHQTGQPLPGVAQVAIQMGRCAAENVCRALAGEASVTFRYRDFGSMATIGRRRAVAWVGRLRLGGVLAWLIWLFVHLMALVGFRNRLVVLTQWAWSYLTWERSARLIRGSAKAEQAAPVSGAGAPAPPRPSSPAGAPRRPRTSGR